MNGGIKWVEGRSKCMKTEVDRGKLLTDWKKRGRLYAWCQMIHYWQFDGVMRSNGKEWMICAITCGLIVNGRIVGYAISIDQLFFKKSKMVFLFLKKDIISTKSLLALSGSRSVQNNVRIDIGASAFDLDISPISLTIVQFLSRKKELEEMKSQCKSMRLA